MNQVSALEEIRVACFGIVEVDGKLLLVAQVCKKLGGGFIQTGHQLIPVMG